MPDNTIILHLPLGYSAVHTGTHGGLYRYNIRRGLTPLGALTYSASTRAYGWFPLVGTPVVDITDPKKIPYS